MSDTESIGQVETTVAPPNGSTTIPTTEIQDLAIVEVKSEDTNALPHPSSDVLVRNEELSFDDGNLIIVAESTSFLVHRSVLSRKSALFKDLLSLPQPVSEEKIDGLPVVRLLDSAKDTGTLIDAIYNGEKYRYKDDEGPEWPVVQKLLALGTKYQIEDLRDEAIQQLHRRYPRKMSGWDETCRTDSDYPGGQSTIIVSYSIEEDMAIANVARAMDLPEIRLPALYGCCSLNFETLVNGRLLEDGTRERLCSEDLIACLQGKENLLVNARARIRMSLFAPETRPPPNCRTPDPCAEKTAAMHTRYNTAEARPSRMYDPLRPEDEEIERQCADFGLCYDCIKFYLARHATLRQEIRSNLGAYICAQPKV